MISSAAMTDTSTVSAARRRRSSSLALMAPSEIAPGSILHRRGAGERGGGNGRLAAHALDELAVGVRLRDLVAHELHGVDDVQRVQELPEDPDAVQHALVDEHL